MDITLVILLSSFAWVFTHYEPLQRIIEVVLGNRTGLIFKLIKSVLQCSKCFALTFSIVFLYCQQPEFNFYTFCQCCLISVVTLILSLTINKLTF